ncbi:GGDEF domain-containing protein [Herbaspirillum frisingense]|uniref:GGDEF domain-containing protein n=1 Tax=Herbaspirillum frisingense TaxID=92645 RepID=UPI0015FF5FAC|nr:GGDEF domain-containing protein [Herbaspirillum frisingense]QNB06109.1 GGDEF domain-containing protein [Herbaspirillum frisingense]
MNVFRQDTKPFEITDEEREAVDLAVRHQLQPLILQLHIVNLGMLAIAVALFGLAGFPVNSDYYLILTGLLPGFALAFYMARSQRNALSFQYSGIVFGACAAVAWRYLGDGLVNVDFWLIPLCLLLTFTASFVFASVWRHFLYTLICWMIMLKRGAFDSGVPGQESLTIFMAVGSIGLASAICLLSNQARRRHVVYTFRLQRLANYDALTGLRNRRFFLELADATLTQDKHLAGRHFALIDVDNFKQINDEFGHDVGDRVLQQVADVIGLHTGQHLSGRFGGEEFAILLSDLELRDARAFVDELLAAIERSRPGSLRVTVSIGMALRLDGEALPDMIRRADEALYKAKRAGKNCWMEACNAPAKPVHLKPLKQIPEPGSSSPTPDATD